MPPSIFYNHLAISSNQIFVKSQKSDFEDFINRKRNPCNNPFEKSENRQSVRTAVYQNYLCYLILGML